MIRLMQVSFNQNTYIGKIHPDNSIQVSSTPTLLIDLVLASIETKISIEILIEKYLSNQFLHFSDLEQQSTFQLPLTTTAPTATWFGGSGLTHKRRATIRKAMEPDTAALLSDSEIVYLDGLKNGKPANKELGARPEWFFKGHATNAVTHGNTLIVPWHDQGGGEEAELVGVYYIDNNKHPHRVGFCLGNEFADHILEKQNHFYISQCKMRHFAIGSEIVIGDTPQDISLSATIQRNNALLWEANIPTGEKNMVHSFSNLEQYIFMHDQLRIPNTVYYHFMGTANISYTGNITLEDQDEVLITSNYFQLPLKTKISKNSSKNFININYLS